MEKKGGGGVSNFSVENFLSQIAEKFRRGTLESFFIFGYLKKTMLQMVMSRFSVEVFWPKVPKHFVEETFCAVIQKKTGSEEIYG